MSPRAGLLRDADADFVAVLGAIGRSGYAPERPLGFFHFLRQRGNDAVHNGLGDFGAALNALKIGRELAGWYARSYGERADLKLGPYTPPPEPPDPTAELREELGRLRAEADAHRTAAESQRARAEGLADASRTAEERAVREAADREVWQRLAEEEACDKDAAVARVAALQQAAEAAPAKVLVQLEQAAETAAEQITLDEAATRDIIDQQLRDAEWEADSRTMRHGLGARPTKGRNMAIAEWPTADGRADYALFAGLKLVGTVEAKRRNKNVMGALDQAERYSIGITVDPACLADGLHGAGTAPPSCSRPTAGLICASSQPSPASGGATRAEP